MIYYFSLILFIILSRSFYLKKGFFMINYLIGFFFIIGIFKIKLKQLIQNFKQ